MGPEQAEMFIESENGRGMLLSLAETKGQDHFESIVGSWGVDVEALSMFTVQNLADENAAKLSQEHAQIVYDRIKALMKPQYGHLRKILQHNQVTRTPLLAYIDLADDYRKMMKKGVHPLGKTLRQMMMEMVR